MTKEIKGFLGRLKHELEMAKDNYDDAKPSERSYLYGLWRGIHLLTNNLEYKALVDKDDKPEADGWIKHDGGSVPIDKCGDMVVSANKNIEIKRRDGVLEKVGLAGKVKWAWCKHYDELNIMEFRVIDKPETPPIEEKQAKRTLMQWISDRNLQRSDFCDMTPREHEHFVVLSKYFAYLEQKDIPVRKVPRHV